MVQGFIIDAMMSIGNRAHSVRTLLHLYKCSDGQKKLLGNGSTLNCFVRNELNTTERIVV